MSFGISATTLASIAVAAGITASAATIAGTIYNIVSAPGQPKSPYAVTSLNQIQQARKELASAQKKLASAQAKGTGVEAAQQAVSDAQLNLNYLLQYYNSPPGSADAGMSQLSDPTHPGNFSPAPLAGARAVSLSPIVLGGIALAVGGGILLLRKRK